MNSKKIMITALIVAIVAVILVNLYVGSIRSSYTRDPVVVFQAVRDIPAGKPVNAQDYREITLPSKVFESVTAYAVTRQDMPVLASTPLRRPLKTGDIISYTHLSRTVQEGLRDMIPPGKRAVSIRVTEETSVSNFVQSGDLVDIIATLVGTDKAVTKPLLTGIRVLAVGGEYGDTSNQAFVQRGQYGTVTLEVTTEEAERLIFARDQLRANMTLLLRNPKDQAEPAPTAVISGSDLMTPQRNQ
jgi:pilus assembly protein CpaB